jgi:serine/threonine protein kinase
MIAQGGMGAIVNAKDLCLRRPVAMKRMLAEEEDTKDQVLRFIEEAQVTGQLEHPNIIPVHELGVDEEEHVFYTMKLVKGITLQAILQGIAMKSPDMIAHYPFGQLLTIFQKVCDAVAFAHSKRVVHRDLKPENIMIGDYGEVLVMDWGLAKIVSEKAGKPSESGKSLRIQEHLKPEIAVDSIRKDQGTGFHTRGGRIMGTPNFMAPEQASGRVDDIDARTDIWALGGILYHILTLEPPIKNEDLKIMFKRIVTRDIAPPTSYNSSNTKTLGGSKVPHCPSGLVPEALSAVALKALSLDPRERYQKVKELQKDIESYQGGFATVAERAGLFKQLAPLVKRHKTDFALIGAGFAIFIVLVTVFIIGLRVERNRVTEQKNRAEATLIELRKTAPAFHDQAVSLAAEKKFDQAIEKIDYAISLEPENAEYRYQKGNMLQSMLRIKEAKDSYHNAAYHNKGHELAIENQKLCEKILKDNEGRKDLLPTSIQELQAAMQKQKRFLEAAALLSRVQSVTQDKKVIFETWKGVLEKAGLWSRMQEQNKTLLQDGNGMLQLDLSNMPVDSLKSLKGMPLSELRLDYTKINDLSPLKGMALVHLSLGVTKVNDLSVLKGMPLTALILNGTEVTDLSPLKGMQLTQLNISNTQVSDLSPLKGMFITNLNASQTSVSDLSALSGMPLVTLILANAKAKDISVLSGMPLAKLNLSGLEIADASILKTVSLRELNLGGSKVADLGFLKSMVLDRLEVDRTPVSDISMLKGMPIHYLNLANSQVSDLNSLRGLPLKFLALNGCPNVIDLAPVSDCKELETLFIPSHCKNIDFLKKHPGLKFLDYKWTDPAPSTAEFWKKFDSEKK